MSRVIDASVLVSALIESRDHGVWARESIANSSLAAPELAVAEATNILRRLEARGSISRLEASASRRDLLRLRVDLYPFTPFADRVWQLRSNLTCYDAAYVALAEALDWPLLTLDRRISRASGTRCQIVIPAAQE